MQSTVDTRHSARPLTRRRLTLVAAQVTLALASATACAQGRAEASLAPVRVVGDGMPAALGAANGDAQRGRALIIARDAANCILCHEVPDAGARFSGNVGPSLDGVGSRLTVAQLRLRIADNVRLNPNSVMPSYYRVEGLDRVASAYRGKPILSALQIEDLVAYCASLK